MSSKTAQVLVCAKVPLTAGKDAKFRGCSFVDGEGLAVLSESVDVSTLTASWEQDVRAPSTVTFYQ